MTFLQCRANRHISSTSQRVIYVKQVLTNFSYGSNVVRILFAACCFLEIILYFSYMRSWLSRSLSSSVIHSMWPLAFLSEQEHCQGAESSKHLERMATTAFEDDPTRVLHVALFSIFSFFAVLAVILRLWSRKVQRHAWDWSDYLIILGLVSIKPTLIPNHIFTLARYGRWRRLYSRCIVGIPDH